MKKPCVDILKSSHPDLHKFLEDKNGVFDDTDTSKQAYIKAAKELQSQSLNTINEVYSQIGIEGFKKSPPVPAQPKADVPKTDVVGSDVAGDTENAIVKFQQNNPEVRDLPLNTIEEDLNIGDTVYGNISGQKIAGKVKNVGVHKGKIVVDITDQNGNDRFLYSKNIERIEPKQKEVERLTHEQNRRYLELINKEETTSYEISELGELGKMKRGEISNPSKELPTPKKSLEAAQPKADVPIEGKKIEVDSNGEVKINGNKIISKALSDETKADVKEFVDTKVVDEKGNPKEVFHGTWADAPFEDFKEGDTYFTDNYDTAKMFGINREGGVDVENMDMQGKPFVMEVTDTKGKKSKMVIANTDMASIFSDLQYDVSPVGEWGKEDLDAFDARSIEHHFGIPKNKIKSFKIEERKVGDNVDDFGVSKHYISIKNPLIIDAKGGTWNDSKDGNVQSKINEARDGGKHDGVIIKNIVEGGISNPDTKPTTTYVVFNKPPKPIEGKKPDVVVDKKAETEKTDKPLDTVPSIENKVVEIPENLKEGGIIKKSVNKSGNNFFTLKSATKWFGEINKFFKDNYGIDDVLYNYQNKKSKGADSNGYYSLPDGTRVKESSDKTGEKIYFIQSDKFNQSEPKKEIPAFHKKVDDVADSLIKALSAKLPEGTKKQGGGDIATIIRAAADIIKKAHDIGGDIKKAIDDAVKYVRDQFKKNNLGDVDEKVIRQHFENEEIAGKTPPPKEPIITESKESGKPKSLANRLVNAENIPVAAKEGITSEGLNYEPKSQKEAEGIAKAVIDELGIDEAVLQAKAQTFGGDVNTLIQTESLNRLAELSDKETDPAKRLEHDKKFAEVGIGLDEWLRKQGRGISAVNYFYKKSPLGVQMMENAKRKQDFDTWSKPKEKSWKEFFDEMMKEPEFDAVVKEQIKESLKKERAVARENRTKKVDDVIDKAINKFKNNGATYSIVIPPKVITVALEGIKKAYHTGEAVAKIIQDAIDYISVELGNAPWDKEKFRKEWETTLSADREKIDYDESYKTKLKNQIKDLDEQIANKKRNPPKERIKKEYDDETNELIEERDEKKKELDEAVPRKKILTDEEVKKKILDKFRTKLQGLTDKQKEEVIIKSFSKIVESGGLDYPDFRQIIADVTGRGELTDAEAQRLKELVTKLNAVDDAGKKAMDDRTPDSLKKFKDAEHEASKAARELNELIYTKPNIIKRLTSIMQLNTLGIPALINNPIYNIWNQATLRYPVGLINSLIDRGLSAGSRLFGRNYTREYNTSLAIQKEFFRKLGFGAKESFEQLVTGLSRQDYIEKEIHSEQIRPFTSLKDLYKFATGKRNLTTRQVIDRALQGTVGIPAETIARVLNMGDKPQRFSAEGAQAAAFAKALGLRDIDYELFIEFPREEAYRVYKEKGLSDTEAGVKADYVKEVIIKEGKRSTFQQDNFLSDKLNKLFGGEKSGVGSLLKSVTVSPYIKIPSNAYWSYYNLVNPEVAILQAIYHGGKAFSLRNKEGNSSKLALREARYWFAHAVTGIAMRGVITALVGAGVFASANTGDDDKKEREGEQFFEPQGTINLTKLFAFLRGEDTSKIKNSVTIGNRWFGQWGTVGNAIARKYEEATPEQRAAQDEFWNIAFGGMETEALKDLEQGVFSNTSALLGAMNDKSGYFLSRYGMSTINMFANIVHPAALAQISRAELPYYSTARSDSFMEELRTSMLQRSSVLRAISDKYPPAKISIWGDTMKREGNVITKLFGINSVNKDNFAQPIYEDAKRTGDTDFFPPAMKPELGGKKLNNQQYRRLQELVGKARRDYIAPYINNSSLIEGYKVRYSDMDNDDKKYVLDYLYEQGRSEGIDKLAKEFPELKKEAIKKDQLKESKKKAFRAIHKYKK